MQIQPSFCVKLRRFCAQQLADGDPLQPDIRELVDRLAGCTRGDQHQVMAALFTALGRFSNGMDLGFLIGGRMPVTAYGALSLGVLTAPTIGDALRFVAAAHHLVLPLIDLAYEEATSEGRLTIGFRSPIDSVGEALIVAMFTAALEAEIGRRSGRSGNLIRLELTPSSKGTEASYRKWLSLVPHTDGKSNTLILGHGALGLPSAHADADTFESIMSACAETTGARVCEATLRERVREAVMSAIGAPPSQERLARMLDLTPRQLRIRLGRERTSYQAIIRKCRVEYASALLQNFSLPLAQVADRLGYGDLSAFSHAFCRWTGKSPSAFRIDMHARGSSS